MDQLQVQVQRPSGFTPRRVQHEFRVELEAPIPVDDSVIQLLEARHEEYLADPTKVISWEALKAKLGRG
jgi:hypothetical protein